MRQLKKNTTTQICFDFNIDYTPIPLLSNYQLVIHCSKVDKVICLCSVLCEGIVAIDLLRFGGTAFFCGGGGEGIFFSSRDHRVSE